MDDATRQLEDVLRDYGERWQIRYDDEYRVWTAVCYPSLTAQRFLVAYDLPGLVVKLRAVQFGDR
jgi:hypothetical protein